MNGQKIEIALELLEATELSAPPTKTKQSKTKQNKTKTQGFLYPDPPEPGVWLRAGVGVEGLGPLLRTFFLSSSPLGSPLPSPRKSHLSLGQRKCTLIHHL